MISDPNFVTDMVKLLASEPMKALLGPSAQEAGIFLGHVASKARQFATENLDNILGKLGKNLQAKGQVLDAEEFRRILPLLPAASVVADDELQERWAALLESAASAEPNYLPSFGQTLSQLTADEARYLDRLWKFVSQPLDYLSDRPPGMQPLSDFRLVQIYDPTIGPSVNTVERQLYKDRLSAEQIEMYERFMHAELVIDDLVRLGILDQTQKAEPEASVGIRGSRTFLVPEYSLSHYGISFILAVSPKKTVQQKRTAT
jgi:Abortive infection alpha